MLFGVSVRHKARSEVQGPVDATENISHVHHIVNVVEKMAAAIHTQSFKKVEDVEMEAVESEREFEEDVDHDEEDIAYFDDAEKHYFEDGSDQDNDDYEEVAGIFANPDYE